MKLVNQRHPPGFRHKRSVAWAERNRNTVSRMPTLQPPRPPRDCCFQQAGNTALDLCEGKSATVHLYNPSEEALHELTASSALENLRCATDLTASASQDHLPGITLDTHRCGSLSPTSRGRSTSDYHRPKVDGVPDPHLILTNPASWDCRVRITSGTTLLQVGPPPLPKERKQTALWQQSTLATLCSCGCGFERTLHQNRRHTEQQDTEDVRNSKYAC